MLGPVRVLGADGQEVPLGPPQQRAVLAVLLLQEGCSISYDALVDAVWDSQPPCHVGNLVQRYVSGLRRCLGDAVDLTRAGGGFRLTA
ncbi:winged helix-turn-helix domain-containing protein [Streptomyces sp. NBC_00006]|uniref:AfsR/SARP family transcriptional regulator n=1 Tax=Streptomyces sp. NBC_00006 TaxID=2975619 RepID=UPI0022518698|nr:winged helix-turn-helix domain-containing protein [Streptomyces sp. NBC_00006]MCX5529630.1 winged helix-turn-helix domain-containing protein [Streptomyces sp. NBC_00006]